MNAAQLWLFEPAKVKPPKRGGKKQRRKKRSAAKVAHYADLKPMRPSQRPLFEPAVKVQRVPELINTSAPPKPSCFDTQQQWVLWLKEAHLSGVKITRRLDLIKPEGRVTRTILLDTDRIDYCSECSFERRLHMKAKGRCKPSSVAFTHLEEQDRAPARPLLDLPKQPAHPFDRMVAALATAKE